jgi:3-phenylpropionate/trans-cinnamate dioxygenase ferredoxin reductase subunit
MTEMEKYKYLIVGGGMTADAAVRGIREIDQQGSIGLISAEKDEPYKRPLLSKGLWKQTPFDKIWLHTAEEGADLILGKIVSSLNLSEKKIKLADDRDIAYEKLLLATGATPRHLPIDQLGIIYYRTLEDYRHVHELSQQKKKFIVIGSGFIGSEIAAALSINDCKVELLDTLTGIGWNIFPPAMVEYLNQYFVERNIRIHTQMMVTGINHDGDEYVIKAKDGREFRADVVIAGIGVLPEISLASQAGILVENGILVDENLRTNAIDVYSAGDVALFISSALGRRVRVEHEDNAKTMGRLVGRNMAGVKEIYNYLPMFYSDLFDLGYEAVGSLDSRMEIVEDWEEKYQKGVLYYLDNDRVRGVLLWNVWNKLEVAREYINVPGPFKAEDLVGKIK